MTRSCASTWTPILPTAVRKDHLHSKTPINSIGNIFQDLKRDILKCVSLSFNHEYISLKDDTLLSKSKVNYSVLELNTFETSHNPSKTS